jgi:hypothetical protein
LNQTGAGSKCWADAVRKWTLKHPKSDPIWKSSLYSELLRQNAKKNCKKQHLWWPAFLYLKSKKSCKKPPQKL